MQLRKFWIGLLPMIILGITTVALATAATQPLLGKHGNELKAKPAHVNFGTLHVGSCTAVIDGKFDTSDPTCKLRSVRLKNVSGEILSFQAIGISGGSVDIVFEGVDTTCTFVLQPGESCTVTITAHAVSEGTSTGSLDVLQCANFSCLSENITVLARVPLKARAA